LKMFKFQKRFDIFFKKIKLKKFKFSDLKNCHIFTIKFRSKNVLI
jgi:hypothetical protein